MPEGVEMTHRNLYDGTVEGLASEELGAASVQYHPESNPGPRDSGYLFDHFIEGISGALQGAR
jgi:carbamoyl-phosphate synthase small subunit